MAYWRPATIPAADGGQYGAAAQWKQLADALCRAWIEHPAGTPIIPVWFGIDAVQGQANLVESPLLPQNVGLITDVLNRHMSFDGIVAGRLECAWSAARLHRHGAISEGLG